MTDINPGDKTVTELRDELEGIDDPGKLQEILELEQENKDRKGAKRAIERRLGTVSKDGGSADPRGDTENDTDASSDGDTAPADGDERGGATPEDGQSDLIAVQKTVRSNTADLVGHELDSVTEISERDGAWRAVVDVVERPSIPDTQDILARYEIDLDESGSITGFRRLDRYRRGETSEMR